MVQTGTEKLGALKVFLLSNNKVAAWSEVERLGGLTSLEELLLVGNPLYNEFKDKGETQQYRIEVLHLRIESVTGLCQQSLFACSCLTPWALQWCLVIRPVMMCLLYRPRTPLTPAVSVMHVTVAASSEPLIITGLRHKSRLSADCTGFSAGAEALASAEEA